MSLGLGIFLFALGAILTFALDVTLDWINLDIVGYILMLAGLVVIILGIVLIARRRSAVSTSQTTIDPATGSRVTRNESTTSGDDIV